MPGGSASKRKGDKYERDVVAWLKRQGIRVDKAKRGNRTGDILGIADIVVECKDQGTLSLGAWIDQTNLSVIEARAIFGLLFVKRKRFSYVGDHFVVMNASSMLALLRKAGYVADQ